MAANPTPGSNLRPSGPGKTRVTLHLLEFPRRDSAHQSAVGRMIRRSSAFTPLSSACTSTAARPVLYLGSETEISAMPPSLVDDLSVLVGKAEPRVCNISLTFAAGALPPFAKRVTTSLSTTE